MNEGRKPSGCVLSEANRTRHARGGGASTVPMAAPDIGARAMLNGFTDIPPGASIPLHLHNCEESVLIVSGSATIEIDGARTQGRAGDVVWVPAEVPHRFLNETQDTHLRIFWTYADGAATRTLIDTGETRPVAAEAAS